MEIQNENLNEHEKEIKNIIKDPKILYNRLNKNEIEKLEEGKKYLPPDVYYKVEENFFKQKALDYLYNEAKAKEFDYFLNRPFIDPKILEGYIGNGLNPELRDAKAPNHPEYFVAELGYQLLSREEGLGTVEKEEIVDKSTGEIKERERISYSDKFYEMEESLGLNRNFRRNKSGELKGQIRKSGDLVLHAIPKLKTRDLKDEVIQVPASVSSLVKSDHIMNMENLYYGESSNDTLKDLLHLYGMVLKELETTRINNDRFCILRNGVTEEQIQIFGNLRNRALLTNNEKDIEEAIEYGKSIFIMRSELTNMHLPETKFECEVREDFVEEINNYIEKLKEKYLDIKQLVDEGSLEALKLNDNIITSKYFYLLRKICVRKYRRNYGKVNVAMIDFDFDDKGIGFCHLIVMCELLKDFECEIILNKTCGHKKYHGTVIFPLHEFKDIDEVRPVDDFFKLLGINDMNHKYHVGKCTFNYDLFHHLKSPGKRNILEIMDISKSRETELGRILRSDIIGLYDQVYRRKPGEDYSDLDVEIEFLYKKSRKPIVSIDEETLEQKAKLGFYHFDNYEFYHDILIDYFKKKSNNNLSDLFTDENYMRIFKDKSYLYQDHEEILGNKEKDYKSLEESLSKINERRFYSNIETDLTDNYYDEDNYLVDEFKDFVFKTHSTCSLNEVILEFFKNYPNDVIEINKSRWSIPSSIAYQIGANAYINSTVEEVKCFLLSNLVHFCNSDDKYSEDKIKSAITRGYNMGRKKLKDSNFIPVNAKYDSVKKFWGCYSEARKSILRAFNNFINDFIYLKDLNKFKKENRKNKHYKVFLNVSELLKKRNYKAIYKLLKEEYLKTLEKSLNNIKDIREQRKAILKINEEIKTYIKKLIHKYNKENKESYSIIDFEINLMPVNKEVEECFRLVAA